MAFARTIVTFFTEDKSKKINNFLKIELSREVDRFYFNTIIKYILRFTVALPLIFACVILVIFCCNNLTEGAFLISPVASLGLAF